MSICNEHTTPIRVLQVFSSLNRGGAETMVLNLYRHIDREKIQFDFLVHSDKKGLYDDEVKELGANIYYVQSFKGYNLWAYYNDCYTLLKKHPEIKAVHGHIGSCAAIYLLAAKKCRMFTIAHSHNAGWRLSLHDIGYRVFSFPTRYIAEQLFGCSTEAGITRFGKKAVKKSKYKNFNNAIDLDEFYFDLQKREKFRNSLGIDDSTLLIGTVGRITEQKNPQKIYDIFHQAVSNNDNVKCLWVGTGEKEDLFRKKIEAEGLQEKILMLGVRTDVANIMQGLDEFVLPSLWEGLPVVVIEAQAAGLPCIISKSISREVEITDLIKWIDVEDDTTIWSNTILNNAVIKRKDTKAKLCDAGYDIKIVAEWLENFYEEAAQKLTWKE